MVNNIAETLKRTVKHNIFAKIMAVVSSLVLWLFVMENENPTIERTYTLPIEVANAQDDYEYSLSKRSIKINVFAKRIYFATLDTDKMHATIDLEKVAGGGNLQVPILVELPNGYESVEKSVDAVDVLIDPYVLSSVPLDIKERGTSADIAKVGSIVKQENVLNVRGTASNCAKVNKLVGYVDVAGKENDFDQEVILIPVDESFNEVYNVHLPVPTTIVKVIMKKSFITKNVTVTPVFANSDATVQTTVTPMYITITGEEEILQEINTVSTEPLKNVEGSVKAKIILPPGVTSKTETVMVGVEK